MSTTNNPKQNKRTREIRKTGNPTVLPGSQNEDPDTELGGEAFEPGHAPRPRIYPGRNPSPKRVEEYTCLRKLDLIREAEREAGVPRGALPDERDDELGAQAKKEVEATPELNELDETVTAEWASSSCVEDEHDVESECVVIAAVLMLRHVLWFMLSLAGRTGRRGPAPARKLVATTILHMAFRRGRPEVGETRKLFKGSHALLNWTYRVPMNGESAPGRVDFYKAVHAVFDPKNLNERMIEHLQVETFRQWAQQTYLDRKGQEKLKHPKAALALICDGSFAQGQAEQTPIASEEQRQIRILHRPDRGGIHFMAYGSDGNFRRSVVGYKLVALVCPIGGRAVITTLVPANMHEPDAVIYLLERLFELCPSAPSNTSRRRSLRPQQGFLRELLFRFGIDPVFPWRADYPKDIGIKGVPVCHCAGTPRPMRLLQRKGKWWGSKQRLTENLPHGKWAPDKDLRLRYEYCCPDAEARGRGGGCPNQTTYPWDDPRIYTYMPHAAVRDRYATKYHA